MVNGIFRGLIFALGYLLVTLSTGRVAAGPDYFSTGDGRSGTLNVAAGENVVVNSYSGLARDVPSNATSVVVDDAADFEAGDLILLWQAAGLPDPGGSEQETVDIATTDVGRFEFARIVTVAAATETLTLVDPITEAFAEATTQVVRVPEYSSASVAATGTISAQPWDGDVGGIIVFLVSGVLLNDGQVNADGAGFRGGAELGDGGTFGCDQLNVTIPPTPAELDDTAQKGEGISTERFGTNHRARANVVNGGGGGVCHNSGGGGGGHAGAGGKGGRTYFLDADPDLAGTGRDVGGFPGVALSYNPILRMTLGGGGGGGHQNNNNGGPGAAGGGVIFVRAGTVSGAGEWSADGLDGNDSSNGANDAAGAAGAGGLVVLRAVGDIDCGSVTASGGEGGSVDAEDHGPAGGGGGGYITLQSAAISCMSNVIGGVAGTQADAGDPDGPTYGAESGQPGTASAIGTAFSIDSDGDGVLDVEEGASDTDSDGLFDFQDADDDNDTIPTAAEGSADSDGDGVPNHRDLDSDGDGLPDALENGFELAADSTVADFTDDDLDGLHDLAPTEPLNTDEQDQADYLDADSDNDSVDDAIEAFDADGDGAQDVSPLGNDHDRDGLDDQYDGDCPAGVGCLGGSTTVDLAALSDAQDADQDGLADWLESCVDGYLTGDEVCDDGDADGSNTCTNSCLLNLNEVCVEDAECDSGVCEAGVCEVCRDNTTGAVDDGCSVLSPICRDAGGGSSVCATCADTEAGATVDEGCPAGAPQCDESAEMNTGACLGCAVDGDCDDGSACTIDSCDSGDGSCSYLAVTAGEPCLDTVVGTCDADLVCVSSTACDPPCFGATPACDESETPPVCVACVVDSDCGETGACTIANTCVNCFDDQPGADQDRGCAEAEPICEVIGGFRACRACLDTAGSGATDLGCSDETPICAADSGPGCVECDNSADCDPGETCTDEKTCQPSCATDDDCSPFTEIPVCNTDEGICAECVTDEHCPTTQVCEANVCSVTDSDGDGVQDDSDPDDDNDGILDEAELGGADLSVDGDGDGIAGYIDADETDCADEDADGVCDSLARSVDRDGDGIANHLDLDSDGDGIVDVWENGGSNLDADGDGLLDDLTDEDSDGLLSGVDLDDSDASAVLTADVLNSDAVGDADFLDLDADGDGIGDVVEAGGIDDDGDLLLDGTDSDDNGLIDNVDPGAGGTPLEPLDSDGDGDFDFQDADSDDDGVPDSTEGFDANSDGAPDVIAAFIDAGESDANDNGINDAFELPDGALAPLPDTDDDGAPDYRDPDDDDDELPTNDELGPDVDAPLDWDDDGTPDYLDPDQPVDAGAPDASTPIDASIPADDGGVESDAGNPVEVADAGEDASSDEPDGSTADDAGFETTDAGDDDNDDNDDDDVRVGLAGGAGCQTTPAKNPNHPTWWLFALLLLVGTRLIRSGDHRGFKQAATVSLALLATCPEISHAQEGGFALNRYRPAETARDLFQLSRPNDLGHGRVSLQVLMDYSRDPLVVERQQGTADSEFASLVGTQLVAHAGFAVGIADRLVLFVGAPFNVILSGDEVVGFPEADGSSLADPWLGGRVRLVGDRDALFALALQAGVSIPLAHLADDEQAYAGDSSVTAHPELLLELRPASVRLTANVGALIKDNDEIASVETGSELTYALGATISPLEPLNLMVELHGRSALSEFFEREETPVELLGGAKLHLDSGLSVGVAGGPGLTRGLGSPDVRVVGLLGWTTPEPPKVVAPKDRDGDGIIDAADQCADQPEDYDQFEDENGCPDPDNDQDGVADVSDQCPLKAEDTDGFEDTDGCPEDDNDQDGIIDVEDECSEEPEDVDSFEDEDGCPDPDNDRDQVLDGADECPLVAGTQRNNGCPEKIRVEKSQIVILERVEFATNKDLVLERSFPVLEEVSAVLKAAPHLKRLRVEGHTDSRGSDSLNLSLSKRRAHSVRRWLIEAGIEASRLDAFGCGETRPIDTNSTLAGRQANRRVEFHLLDPAPAEPRSTEGCEPAK